MVAQNFMARCSSENAEILISKVKAGDTGGGWDVQRPCVLGAHPHWIGWIQDWIVYLDQSGPPLCTQPGTTSDQNYRPPPDPPSFLGLTAQPRAGPLDSLARRRDACCTCLRGSSATPPTCGVLVNIMPVNSWPGVANWRGSAEPCGVDSSTEDRPSTFPCAASRFFYGFCVYVQFLTAKLAGSFLNDLIMAQLRSKLPHAHPKA